MADGDKAFADASGDDGGHESDGTEASAAYAALDVYHERRANRKDQVLSDSDDDDDANKQAGAYDDERDPRRMIELLAAENDDSVLTEGELRTLNDAMDGTTRDCIGPTSDSGDAMSYGTLREQLQAARDVLKKRMNRFLFVYQAKIKQCEAYPMVPRMWNAIEHMRAWYTHNHGLLIKAFDAAIEAPSSNHVVFTKAPSGDCECYSGPLIHSPESISDRIDRAQRVFGYVPHWNKHSVHEYTPALELMSRAYTELKEVETMNSHCDELESWWLRFFMPVTRAPNWMAMLDVQKTATQFVHPVTRHADIEELSPNVSSDGTVTLSQDNMGPCAAHHEFSRYWKTFKIDAADLLKLKETQSNDNNTSRDAIVWLLCSHGLRKCVNSQSKVDGYLNPLIGKMLSYDNMTGLNKELYIELRAVAKLALDYNSEYGERLPWLPLDCHLSPTRVMFGEHHVASILSLILFGLTDALTEDQKKRMKLDLCDLAAMCALNAMGLDLELEYDINATGSSTQSRSHSPSARSRLDDILDFIIRTSDNSSDFTSGVRMSLSYASDEMDKDDRKCELLEQHQRRKRPIVDQFLGVARSLLRLGNTSDAVVIPRVDSSETVNKMQIGKERALDKLDFYCLSPKSVASDMLSLFRERPSWLSLCPSLLIIPYITRLANVIGLVSNVGYRLPSKMYAKINVLLGCYKPVPNAKIPDAAGATSKFGNDQGRLKGAMKMAILDNPGSDFSFGLFLTNVRPVEYIIWLYLFVAMKLSLAQPGQERCTLTLYNSLQDSQRNLISTGWCASKAEKSNFGIADVLSKCVETLTAWFKGESRSTIHSAWLNDDTASVASDDDPFFSDDEDNSTVKVDRLAGMVVPEEMLDPHDHA
jgi:hypothetical protein